MLREILCTVIFMSRERAGVSGSGSVLMASPVSEPGRAKDARAELACDYLTGRGESSAQVDLADHPIPLYRADLETRARRSRRTQAFAQRIAAAEVLLTVSREYNGAIKPLSMKIIDRLTRENTGIVAHPEVFLASASSGGCGAKNVALVNWSMHNIAAADRTLSISSNELVADRTLSAIDKSELAVLVDQAVACAEVAS